MTQATLTVWNFSRADGAAAAARTVEQLAGNGLISVHDAATVSWEAGTKKPKTHQLSATAGVGAAGGAFWGMLFGLIFFVPLLGAAVGAATSAFAGSLSDAGIDEGFINQVRDQITPGTSALFLLSSDAVVDEVKDALRDHEPRGLIFTNLSADQEAALRQVFEMV